VRAISEALEARLAAVRAETPAAWAVLAHGTEAPATFPQGLLPEAVLLGAGGPRDLPGRSPTAHVQAKICEEVSNKETRNHFEPRDVRVSLPRRAEE
jgi:hypothetical protein